LRLLLKTHSYLGPSSWFFGKMIGQVDSVEFSTDSTKALVGVSVLHGNLWQGEVRIANFSGHEEEFVMEPEIAPAYALPCGVSEVTWVTPNKTLAVAADDSNVHILSLGSAEDDGNGLLELNLETVLSDHSNIVTSVSSIRSHVVSSSFDGKSGNTFILCIYLCKSNL